jgi:hypothetical protein
MSSARAYPRKVEIERAVSAAKASGMDIAGIEISPDGHIRLIEARAIPQPQNDFDRWEGRL